MRMVVKVTLPVPVATKAAALSATGHRMGLKAVPAVPASVII
jgi:hypothetical protein